MSRPRLSVEEIGLFERDVALRLPFRFGVTTVTQATQAVARVRIRLEDGSKIWGVAAESLAAKWFDKNLALSDEDNLAQLRQSLAIACRLYREHGPATAFGLFAGTHEAQTREAAALGLNPLVAGYGPALLDRAVLDALGRAFGTSFAAMIRDNLPGIEAETLAPDLAGFDMDGFLAGLAMAPSIAVRHTVGLVDPLTAADRPERCDDGLPETLQEVARAYGCRHYKLKVSGRLGEDLERLSAIAAVLDREVPGYAATLDGNEQYRDVEEVVELWRRMAETPALERLVAAILFIEQPIARSVALERSVEPLARHRPVILDESDGTIDAFLQGRALGYTGISSKTCKGFFKSFLNAARCAAWNREAGGERFFMSAEDLTTWAGVSVQQDLALVATLGLGHVERNGHHFIDGMSFAPEAEQQAFLEAHQGLYARSDGTVRLRIEDGRLDLRSLDCPGFATAAMPDFASMRPMPPAPEGPILVPESPK